MEPSFAMTLLSAGKQQLCAQLRAANEVTAAYGLTLSEAEIAELAERRFEALRSTGRVEFGDGVLPQIAKTFCDSPYLNRHDFADTLFQLQDCFYYFKNESADRIPDDDLIDLMKKYFDGVCEGSLEYLAGTSLEELCRAMRTGEWEDADE